MFMEPNHKDEVVRMLAEQVSGLEERMIEEQKEKEAAQGEVLLLE